MTSCISKVNCNEHVEKEGSEPTLYQLPSYYC